MDGTDTLDDRVSAARPEVDEYVRALLHARARAELFGAADPVRVGRYELLRHLGSGGGGAVFVAWDGELTREVAMKLVVAPESEPEWRQRALAEGQALAKLSHPNIVPVFDVGVVGDRVYLVMELVRGVSLRQYAKSAQRHDIVRAYRQCALGLAAAHAAGLVHRDFKPDNALISDDGRVRVVDFGLSVESGGQTGRAGTPAYMAPEQRRGEPPTPAVDQYALAASLREALDSPTGKLGRIVARAGADDPDARYPTLAAVDAALARLDPTAVRRRRLTFAAAALGVAATSFSIHSARGVEEPCARDGSALAGVWSPIRRGQVVAHIASLGAPYGDRAIGQLDSVDKYAATWLDQRHAACTAHQRGDISAVAYDRRQRCLGSARTQLAAVVELATQVRSDGLAQLIAAIPELPDSASCADAPTIAPPSLAQSAQAQALRDRLDRARVRVQAGAGDIPALASLVEDARTLGYPPLVADALLLLGTANLLTWQLEAAEPPLREAYEEKLRGADYAGAVEAYARHMWVRGMVAEAPLSTLAGVDVVTSLAAGLPRSARFAQALLHNNLGSVYGAAGDPRARDEFITSLTLARDVEGPGAVELSVALSNLALVTADPAERQALFAQRVAIQTRAYGPDHPFVLTTQQDAARMASTTYHTAAAVLEPPCRRMIELHPSYRYQISTCVGDLGWLQLIGGNAAGASRDFALDLDHPLSAAWFSLASGDTATAVARFRPLANAPDNSTWYTLFDAARAELGLGMAMSSTRATAALARASALLERARALHPYWAPIRWRQQWLAER